MPLYRVSRSSDEFGYNITAQTLNALNVGMISIVHGKKKGPDLWAHLSTSLNGQTNPKSIFTKENLRDIPSTRDYSSIA